MLTVTHMLWQEFVMNMAKPMHCTPSLSSDGSQMALKILGTPIGDTVTFMTSTCGSLNR